MATKKGIVEFDDDEPSLVKSSLNCVQFMSQKPNSANSANSSNNTNAVCKPPADAVAAGCIAAAIRRHRRKKHRDSASFEHLVEREKRKRRTTFARFLETFVRKVFDTQEKVIFYCCFFCCYCCCFFVFVIQFILL